MVSIVKSGWVAHWRKKLCQNESPEGQELGHLRTFPLSYVHGQAYNGGWQPNQQQGGQNSPVWRTLMWRKFCAPPLWPISIYCVTGWLKCGWHRRRQKCATSAGDFGTYWRRWRWHRVAISTYKVDQTLPKKMCQKNVPKNVPKKRQSP